MADMTMGVGADEAIAFMVSAGLVYEIIAAACSSPQTAEINAKKRSSTLLKWVYVGLGQAAVFVGIAAYISPKPKAVVAGGVLAGAIMFGSYMHANKAGMASSEGGTESY